MSGYVRAEGGRFVDDDGPLLLRGIGLGNWLVPEGYMWGLPASASSPRQIEALVVSVLGWDGAADFWRRWRTEYIGKDDLAAIARAGFDHVRLPLSWRLLCTADGTLLPEGFAAIDGLVASCAEEGLRVVLDLHAAPGGQTGTNIDDSAGLPELFLDPHWKPITVQLWQAIAERYVHDPTVLAFDLLNEPLPYHWADTFGADLLELYRELTRAIRAVDDRHLLMYEGTRWATDFTAITDRLDDNAALQFHKYWSRPDEDSLGHVLAAAERLALPLYMGEGGENSLDWNVAAVALYERLGISWCAWPYKTIGRATSACALPRPSDWDAFVAYAAGPPTREGRRRAAAALSQLGDGFATTPDMLNQPLLNALMFRPPFRLPAPAYAARSAGVEVRWPSDFDFGHGRDVTEQLDAEADLPPGGTVEFVVNGSFGEPEAIPSGDDIDIDVVNGPDGERRLRVSARDLTSLRAIELPEARE